MMSGDGGPTEPLDICESLVPLRLRLRFLLGLGEEGGIAAEVSAAAALEEALVEGVAAGEGGLGWPDGGVAAMAGSMMGGSMAGTSVGVGVEVGVVVGGTVPAG